MMYNIFNQRRVSGYLHHWLSMLEVHGSNFMKKKQKIQMYRFSDRRTDVSENVELLDD